MSVFDPKRSDLSDPGCDKLAWYVVDFLARPTMGAPHDRWLAFLFPPTSEFCSPEGVASFDEFLVHLGGSQEAFRLLTKQVKPATSEAALLVSSPPTAPPPTVLAAPPAPSTASPPPSSIAPPPPQPHSAPSPLPPFAQDLRHGTAVAGGTEERSMQLLLEGPRWALESIQAEIQREWKDITVSELFAPDMPLSELGQVRRLVGAPHAFTPL